jgi:hypothetical protein
MTAPTFDAHGWCHDMDAAPKASETPTRHDMLLLWDVDISEPISGWWDGTGWCDVIGDVYPTAWRPLPLPPVGAE